MNNYDEMINRDRALQNARAMDESRKRAVFYGTISFLSLMPILDTIYQSYTRTSGSVEGALFTLAGVVIMPVTGLGAIGNALIWWRCARRAAQWRNLL
ncbi:MAG: hypothetical protein ACYDBH_09170 [Acidobacteriaceae bacterium]